MTPKELNSLLLTAVREKVPKETNVVNVLMDILSIGKEAIYRRFRGEVPFTFSEVFIISKKFDISLDKLLGLYVTERTLFDLNLSHFSNPVEMYCSTIDQYIHTFRKINPDEYHEVWDASNRISLLFYMKYEHLLKFHLFKWLYHRNMIYNNQEKISYDRILLPKKLIEKQKEFLHVLNAHQHISIIWDKNVVESLVNDISYFIEIDLIPEEEIRKIKKELFQFINDMEISSATGKYNAGIDIQLYISNIQFDTSYLYMDSPSKKISFIKVYELNTISSADENVFNSVKAWVQSLKKFSVLITQSAEKQRHDFFKRQKEIIEQL